MTMKRIATTEVDLTLEEAVRVRVQDSDYVDLPAVQVDQIAQNFIGQHKFAYSPFDLNKPRALTVSRNGTEHVKDMRFFTNYIASDLTRIRERLTRISEESRRKLRALENAAKAAGSSATELEIRQTTGYEVVHSNSFTRPKDTNAGVEIADWGRDFKTGFTFLPEHQANIIPSTGMTLPWLSYTKYPIREVTLVSDESDLGDTKVPLVSTAPQNTVLDDAVFRHVIMLRQYDDVGNRYLPRSAQVTLLFNLPVSFSINSIRILPYNDSLMYIKRITYLNQSLEEIDLEFSELQLDNTVHLVFGTINAVALNITFAQYAPVDVTKYDANGLREAELNRLLESIGFGFRYTEPNDALAGAVYDFSIQTVEIGYIRYNDLGLFRSSVVEIPNALGFTLNAAFSRTDPEQQGTYGRVLTIPRDISGCEFYLGLELTRGASSIYKELIPLPDFADEVQREILPLLGNTGRAKLIPDLAAGARRSRIYSVVAGDLPNTIKVTTVSSHGLAADDIFFASSKPGNAFDGAFIVSTVLSPTEFTVAVATPSQYLIAVSDLPRSFVYVPGEDPFVVGEGANTLTVGVDYVYTIDGGANWRDSFLLPENWVSISKALRAGDFNIRVLAPKPGSIYWTRYSPLYAQLLGSSKHVRLGRRNVVLTGHFRKANAKLRTVCVLRKFTTDMSATPVVLTYYLGGNQ